ncbi:MAG: FliH/SctL family protein [Alphaproteobacteria bacterium]
MLAQQQTEKILELLTSRSGSEFEKKPINENLNPTGFKPINLADFAKKETLQPDDGQLDREADPTGTAEDTPPEGVSGATPQGEQTENGARTEEDQKVSELENEPSSTSSDESPVISGSQLENLRKEAFDEGYASGFAAAESASEEDIISALDSINKIIKQTEESDVFNKGYIKDFIINSIKEETKQLIGYCVDEMPDKFVARIEEKISRFSYLNEKKTIAVNAEDFKKLESHKKLYDGQHFEFVSSEDLDRGAIFIQVGNITYQD